ncbi:hypothetical protein MLD38_003930 [Melastoma candidum]|uniref:Uncharacterized protein n=1 Tax=Melastoma candidum TaxID=119954 RepID=A0ACB9S615_9MYRT|nr:hypothetical protein MLD38_003930 [Melastoma candidum]
MDSQHNPTGSKVYYSKHKCIRFHLLNEFDSEKRSCRRRLTGHNERREKLAPGSPMLPCRLHLLLEVALGALDSKSS